MVEKITDQKNQLNIVKIKLKKCYKPFEKPQKYNK